MPDAGAMRVENFNALSPKRQQEVAAYFVRFGIERLSAKRRAQFHGRIQRFVWRELKRGTHRIPASLILATVKLWERQARGQRRQYAKRAAL